MALSARLVQGARSRESVPEQPTGPQASGRPVRCCDSDVPGFAEIFLVRRKQLEVLQEQWGRLRLRGQDVHSVSLHTRLSDLYK